MEAQGGGGGGEPDSAWVRTLTHTYYYYSGNEVSVVVEKADNGTILDWSHNVYAVGRKICSASRGALAAEALTKNFIVSDHQGNVRNVFNYDAQQNIILNAAYWYNPFGKQDSVVVYGTGGHRFTYNDKELDDELGFEMYYYGARFYDPSIGRFSSPDPVKDYHNPYSYVRNNPIRYIDPTGMETWGVDFNPELDWGGSIGGSLYGWYDDPFARAVMLADPGTIVTTVDELARWLRMHPGDDSGGQSDPAGSNSSTDMNGTPLDAKEVFRLKTYMTDALQAYSQSGGLVGISPDMYDRAMSFLDAGRVEWADLGGRHGQYIAGDQSEKQSANGFYPGEKIQLNNRDRGLLMSKFGALVASTLVHEVGHSIGQRIYGAGEKYDRCGPGAQARYWASTPWYSGNGPASSDPNVQRRLLYLTAQSRAFFHSPAMWELFLGVTRQGGF